LIAPAAGEEIVVARNGRPVARLVALEPAQPVRQGGWARGEIVIGSDFDAPLPDDVAAAFEGRT
jgi:antitoxin (DNA-binding transcriptional repressor) of toxin-antitoxin stability system